MGIVYNTFPLPPGFLTLTGDHATPLEPLAQAILDARSAWPDATLADLYDPDLMPPSLRTAHQRLDRAVDRLYKRSAASPRNGSAWSISSRSTRRCARRWGSG